MTANLGKVTIVGAGLMGAQIGAEYALGGHDVLLVAPTTTSTASASRRATEALRILVDQSLCTEGEARAAVDRIATATSIELACRGSRIVVESVRESFESKAAVLRAIGLSAPDAIVASNTSSLSISELGLASGIERRLIGTHYWNPPVLMPLVELVPGRFTDGEVLDEMRRVLTSIGKDPVTVSDVPGFVWNRLQFALLREAASLVARGAVDAPTLDRIVREGLGRRWSLVGPFETMALGGRDTFLAIATQLFPELASATDGHELEAVPLPDTGALAARVAVRDAALGAWRRRVSP